MQRHLDYLDTRVRCNACGWSGHLGELFSARLNDFHRLRGREYLEAIGRALPGENARCHCGSENLERA